MKSHNSQLVCEHQENISLNAHNSLKCGSLKAEGLKHVRVEDIFVNDWTAWKYWNKLKERLKKEGSQSVSNCHQLKRAKHKKHFVGVNEMVFRGGKIND